MAACRRPVATAPKQGNLVPVTHGSAIAAFTGINPATAEMVIVTPSGGDNYKVAGCIAPRLTMLSAGGRDALP